MANGLKFSPRKTALALAVAVVCAWQSPVFAHGSEAHMVPLDKTLEAFGADVQWDDYAQMFTLVKDGAYVKVKPGAKTAIVNGKPLDLPVPVVMKEGKAWVSDTFINDVFQSGLDQTFQVEKRPHPLNSLSAAEISEAVTIVKAAPEFQPNTRFTEISLHEPDKAAVWAFALQGTPVDAPRTADVVMLDGKQVMEAVVDLQNKKILSWTPIKGAHGMVLLDDFASVQNIINASSEFAAVLKKHGITDPGKVVTTPHAVAIFERYAGPEYKHLEMGKPNVSTERRELVVRWISTVGNYDYIFDWVFHDNGTIGIDAGATGIEAVKGVLAKTMHDPSAKEDTRYGTLIDHNIVGTTHQHIYNFRLDLDVDGENNTLVAMDPEVKPNTAGGPRTSTMQVNQYTIDSEQKAAQKFDPGTIRLLSNTSKENRMGNPVSYQIIPYAGGTHPAATGAKFAPDEWIYHRLSFMDKQLWVTRYHPSERYPEGKYPNRSAHDTGLGQYAKDDESLTNHDDVVWITTGTTHVARAEEWPIMPTEWAHALLKPWNFFDETPTLGEKKQ